MGAQGIRRRKRKHEMRDESAGMSPGDQRRVFGQFSWNEYSPGGGLERNGFFLRQLNRGPKFPADWRWSVLWALLLVAATIATLMLAIHFV